MFKFGFELEGFAQDEYGKITIPSKDSQTDGFPGLLEIRTEGAGELERQYFDLLNKYRVNPFNTLLCEHVFSPKEKRVLRSRQNSKNAVVVSNVYGKEPKALGNRTLASFQVNISMVQQYAYTDDKGKLHSETYGLFDFVPVIRRLDEVFATEIKLSGRQPGFYAVKDGCRVEYRSLPSSVFEVRLDKITNLFKIIQSTLVGETL